MLRWVEETTMIRAITIEREFGCGAAEIASLVASRLGWGLWDERLTQEIARLTEITLQAVERREWRADPAIYRVFKDFLRGAFEGGLPPTNRLHVLDARRIAAVSETAVNTAFSSGPSVIVGRGAQFFLRNRRDVFHVFLYASRDHKISRLISGGATEDKAIEEVDTTDRFASGVRSAIFRAEMAGTPPLSLNVQYGDGGVLYSCDATSVRSAVGGG